MNEEKNIEEGPGNKEQATSDKKHFPEDPGLASSHALQPATSNQKPETENMEVHHHSHSGHHKKTWKSYFWEFLMLFLAVFCGFMAEYYLEHRIEKERGKQFIESFYQDLKTDTAEISININIDDDKIKKLENLRNCYDIVSKNNNETSCMFDFIKSTAFNNPFKFTDRTMRQLANAGGFRLLKKEDADSIMQYDRVLNDFQDFQTTVYQSVQDNVRNTFNLLVNFNANVQMFKVQGNRIGPNFNNDEITSPLLAGGDKILLNKYFNELLLYYRVTYNHKNSLLKLKEKQIALISYFKNKYHFE